MARKQTVETISADELLKLQEHAEKFAPEKIMIVAGPTFGTILKFILLGAAIGAAGVTFLQNQNTHGAHSEDVLYEGLAAGGAKDSSSFQARAEALLRRAKTLAARAKDVAQAVAENVKPAFQEAVEEGKASAQKTEKDLQDELAREAS